MTTASTKTKRQKYIESAAALTHKLLKANGVRFALNVSIFDLALPYAEVAARSSCVGMTAKSFISANKLEINAWLLRRSKRTKVAACELMVAKPKSQPVKPSVDPASPEFLATYEWRVIRMKALKLHGARCQCCGASAATGEVINVDHIKPRKLFPQLALSLDNLQVLCHDCNHGKGNWDMTDWRQRLLK